MNISRVSNLLHHGVIAVVLALSGIWGCGGSPPAETGPRAVELRVVPEQPSVAQGMTLNLQAMAKLSDGTLRDVTAEVEWTTSEASVATFENAAEAPNGQVRGLTQGHALVTAHYERLTGQVLLGITPPVLRRIELVDAPSRLPKGLSTRLLAMGHYSDGSTVDVSEESTWRVLTPEVLSASNEAGQKGVVRALRSGTSKLEARITTAAGVLSAELSVIVVDAAPTSLQVTVSPVAVGSRAQARALALLSDETSTDVSHAVQWEVEDTSRATVSLAHGQLGRVTGVSVGTTRLKATLSVPGAEDVTGNTWLHVTKAHQEALEVSVTPGTATLLVGDCFEFQARVSFDDGSHMDSAAGLVGWWSEKPEVLAKRNASSASRFCAVAEGTATIRGELNEASGQAVVTVVGRQPPVPAQPSFVTVTPQGVTLVEGQCTTFDVTLTYNNGTTGSGVGLVAFASSNSSVLTYASGNAVNAFCAGAAGTATVSASMGGVSGEAQVTVVAREAPVEARPLAITLVPQEATILDGACISFQATVHYSNGRSLNETDWVAFSSSNAGLLQYSPGRGKGTFCGRRQPGTANVVATFSGVVGEAPVTLVPASTPVLQQIIISPAVAALSVGSYQSLTATCVMSNGAQSTCTSSVAWLSSDDLILQVGNFSGFQAYGVSPGTAAVRAVLNNITSNALNFTVTRPPPPTPPAPALQVDSSYPPYPKPGEQLMLNGAGFSTTPSENVVTDSAGVAFTVEAASTSGLALRVPAMARSGPLTVTRGLQTALSPPIFISNIPVAGVMLNNTQLPPADFAPYFDSIYWPTSAFTSSRQTPITFIFDFGAAYVLRQSRMQIEHRGPCWDYGVRQPRQVLAEIADAPNGPWQLIHQATIPNSNICEHKVDFPLFAVSNNVPARYARLTLVPNEPGDHGSTLLMYELGFSSN